MFWQWLNLLNSLFEDNTILVLDRKIFQLAVRFAVTRAVMLNFDYYTPDFAVWQIEYVLIYLYTLSFFW